jgi:hypothetical protein
LHWPAIEAGRVVRRLSVRLRRPFTLVRCTLVRCTLVRCKFVLRRLGVAVEAFITGMTVLLALVPIAAAAAAAAPAAPPLTLRLAPVFALAEWRFVLRLSGGRIPVRRHFAFGLDEFFAFQLAHRLVRGLLRVRFCAIAVLASASTPTSPAAPAWSAFALGRGCLRASLFGVFAFR